MANAKGMLIDVCHFPPGTCKWNRIENRLFCHINRNWQGVRLETLEFVINLIASTRTETGFETHAYLDEKDYPDRLKVTDDQLAEDQVIRDQFRDEWYYEIRPQT